MFNSFQKATLEMMSFGDNHLLVILLWNMQSMKIVPDSHVWLFRSVALPRLHIDFLNHNSNIVGMIMSGENDA